MTAILSSVKSYIGVPSAETGFDTDIIMGINSALVSLNQMGVGPENPFVLETGTETWIDFLGAAVNLELVKNYICIRTKTFFDPSPNQSISNAYQAMTSELESRILLISEEGGV